MFIGHAVDFDGRGRHDLAIRFKALAPVLASISGPRARWRPMMIVPASLRLVRISPLGHMPGWAPQVPLIGLWKPVEIVARRAPLRVASLRLNPSLRGTSGHLAIDIRLDRPVDATAEVFCAGARLTLDRTGPDRFSGELVIDNVVPWWPHTHGEPALHEASLTIGNTTLDLGRIGFRNLAVDRGADGRGFALRVNDQPMFCRGASWMPPDPLRARQRRSERSHRKGARCRHEHAAHLGTATPESEAFIAPATRRACLSGTICRSPISTIPTTEPPTLPRSSKRKRGNCSTVCRLRHRSLSFAAAARFAQQATMLG